MSGNVYGWNFDWVWSDTRAQCGGSTNSSLDNLQVGYCSNSQPDEENEFRGLRIARSPKF